ncbi:MAG: hypothetical protein IK066_02720, partial [Kiritimatiellae bacterium]|nr:hypothetical protein [Kiritimatiellia bacterium]
MSLRSCLLLVAFCFILQEAYTRRLIFSPLLRGKAVCSPVALEIRARAPKPASNHWKKCQNRVPMIGKTAKQGSNHWKIGMK